MESVRRWLISAAVMGLLAILLTCAGCKPGWG